MTISEASRHALHARLAEVLGAEEAVALMEYLPPAGSADVATKRDLDHLGIELRGEIAELRGEMLAMGGALRQDMGSQMRATYVAMVATMLK